MDKQRNRRAGSDSLAELECALRRAEDNIRKTQREAAARFYADQLAEASGVRAPVQAGH